MNRKQLLTRWSALKNARVSWKSQLPSVQWRALNVHDVVEPNPILEDMAAALVRYGELMEQGYSKWLRIRPPPLSST